MPCRTGRKSRKPSNRRPCVQPQARPSRTEQNVDMITKAPAKRGMSPPTVLANSSSCERPDMTKMLMSL
eukprot:5856096-Amphidinium_carterae.1